MKTDILFAIGGADARFVEEALDYMYSPAARRSSRTPAWRRALRTALIAAVIAALLGAAAYAVSAYIGLHARSIGGDVDRVSGGVVTTVKDVGLTFDFDGLEYSRSAGIKANWLPGGRHAVRPAPPAVNGRARYTRTAPAMRRTRASRTGRRSSIPRRARASPLLAMPR